MVLLLRGQSKQKSHEAFLLRHCDRAAACRNARASRRLVRELRFDCRGVARFGARAAGFGAAYRCSATRSGFFSVRGATWTGASSEHSVGHRLLDLFLAPATVRV